MELLPYLVVWKFVTATNGAQCVMIPGVSLMLRSSAGSWDSHQMVCGSS